MAFYNGVYYNWSEGNGHGMKSGWLRGKMHRHLFMTSPISTTVNFLNEGGLQHQGLMDLHSKILSLKEKTVIEELKNNCDILIKDADKGGAVVIFDSKDYVAEALRKLADTRHEVPPCEWGPHPGFKIYTNLKSLHNRNFITKPILESLYTDMACTPSFYLNPKGPQTKYPPQDPPRETHHLRQWMGHREDLGLCVCLGPLVPCIPSYIKGSSHFIYLLEEFTQTHACRDQTILATL